MVQIKEGETAKLHEESSASVTGEITVDDQQPEYDDVLFKRI
jgi:hypothetical protein